MIIEQIVFVTNNLPVLDRQCSNLHNQKNEYQARLVKVPPNKCHINAPGERMSHWNVVNRIMGVVYYAQLIQVDKI